MPGSPSSTTSELQDHLYQSFLLGRAADVTLDVHALPRWSAQYRLHRVVLTQAVCEYMLYSLLNAHDLPFVCRGSFVRSSLPGSWRSPILLTPPVSDYPIPIFQDLVCSSFSSLYLEPNLIIRSRNLSLRASFSFPFCSIIGLICYLV
jgi:hypothetical protein